MNMQLRTSLDCRQYHLVLRIAAAMYPHLQFMLYIHMECCFFLNVYRDLTTIVKDDVQPPIRQNCYPLIKVEDKKSSGSIVILIKKVGTTNDEQAICD